MNKKRVYIIHGWDGNPFDGIKPWLKRELELRGYEVFVPQMPEAKMPKVEIWLDFLQSFIIEPNENVVLVGHSLGGQIALRYLNVLPDGVKLDKVILVASVIDEIKDLSVEEKLFIQPWLEQNLNVEKVKKSADEIIAFFSDNDPHIPLESEKVIWEEYGFKTVVEHNMGHYNEETNIHEAPSILAEILK